MVCYSQAHTWLLRHASICLLILVVPSFYGCTNISFAQQPPAFTGSARPALPYSTSLGAGMRVRFFWGTIFIVPTYKMWFLHHRLRGSTNIRQLMKNTLSSKSSFQSSNLVLNTLEVTQKLVLTNSLQTKRNCASPTTAGRTSCVQCCASVWP